jgi:hypothetical protein
MRRIATPQNHVAPVLLIKFVPAFPNALTASLPETTGSFTRQHPR